MGAGGGMLMIVLTFWLIVLFVPLGVCLTVSLMYAKKLQRREVVVYTWKDWLGRSPRS